MFKKKSSSLWWITSVASRSASRRKGAGPTNVGLGQPRKKPTRVKDGVRLPEETLGLPARRQAERPRVGFILLTAIIISLLNIAHVLIGAFQTPINSLYLWTGHYFADYFAYVQTMVQGAQGKWLVENPYATDDLTRTFLAWWPDLLLGKLAGFFKISPFVFYWLAVAVFSFLLAFLIFLVIQQLFSKKSFYLQFSTFLITIFAAPFFQIAKENGLKFIPYDFWYAPSKLFERLGKVPRHLLDQILGILIILIMAETFSKINQLSLKNLLKRSLAAAFLLGIILTFSYLAIVLLIVIFLAGAILLVGNYLSKKQISWPIILSLVIILVVDFPIALVVNHLSGLSGVMIRSGAWDALQQLHYPFYFVLLTIGPILVLAPFGVVGFFRKFTPLKLLLALIFFVSWSFYFLPIAPFFKTSNVRFLTPLGYLFLGALAALGIESLASFKPKVKKGLVLGVTGLLFLLFLPSNYFFFQRWLIIDSNLTYLAYPVYESLLFLDSLPDKRAVLTAPTGYLGSYLPIFVDKKVYLGREFYTPNFEEKKALAFWFYEGRMGEIEAQKLLSDNGIGYVFWRESESFPLEALYGYSFLKPIFNNQRAVIFTIKR